MKILFPLLSVIVAIGLFFGYIDPKYQDIKVLRAKAADYDKALAESQQLVNLRDQLLEARKSIPQNDLDRLAKLLPDHLDNVRLVVMLDDIASAHGTRINNVSISTPSAAEQSSVGVAGHSYGSETVTFSVTSTYENFKKIIADLEKSLRVVDVISMNFITSKDNLYQFTVTVRAYWIK